MEALATQLEQLENAELVRRAPDEDLSYLFKHALTQDTAYESLLLRKRREIHREVAQAYAQLHSDRLDEFAALLAHHFAEAGDEEKTAEYAIRAGDVAARVFGYPEARGFYAQALEALARLPDMTANRRRRIDTTIQYVRISWLSDSPEANLARLAEIEPLARGLPGDDPQRRAPVHYYRGRLHLLQNASISDKPPRI